MFNLEQRSSIEALDSTSVDSEGKGRRCLGKLVMPRATFYKVVSITNANGIGADVPLPDVNQSMTMQLPTVEFSNLGRTL